MYYTRIWLIRASFTAVRSYNRLFHNLVRIICFEVRSDMSNKHIGINSVFYKDSSHLGSYIFVYVAYFYIEDA